MRPIYIPSTKASLGQVLVPAAAVIPTKLTWNRIVAVKTLVVGFSVDIVMLNVYFRICICHYLSTLFVYLNDKHYCEKK